MCLLPFPPQWSPYQYKGNRRNTWYKFKMYVYMQGKNGIGMAGSAFTREGCRNYNALKTDRNPRIGTSPKYLFLYVACMLFAQIN